MLRTSIATVCLSGTLTEKLHACAEAGFDGVELFEPDLLASPASPEEIGALARRLGLTLDLYQPFRDAEGVTEPEFAAVLHRARAKFRLMQRLGVDTVLVCSNVGHRDGGRRRGVGRPAASARRRGPGPRRADRLRGARLGAVRGRLPAGVADRGAGRPPRRRGLPGQLPHPVPRARPGRDRADPCGEDLLPAARGRSRADHGRAVLEPAPPAVPGRGLVRPGGVPRARARRRVHRSGLVGGLQRHLPADRRGAHRPAGEAVADVAGGPGRPAPAAVPAGATARAGCRTSGSPSRSTSSRSRRRTPARWTSCCGCSASRSAATTGASRCGSGPRARPGCSATSTSPATGRPRWPRSAWRYPTRRPRCAAPVCSEHPRCSDGPAPASRTWWRSGRRRARRSSSPSPPPPSPRGCRSSTAASEPGGAPALAIDHVNLAHPWQTFEESVLFHTSVLALRSQGTQEVAAPTGLVRSRVMRSDDGAVRLALNVAPVLDRGLPQHVAFRSPDVIAAARPARARGLHPLPIPANYYDDLAARFDLPAAAARRDARARRAVRPGRHRWRVPALLHPHGRRGVLRARAT